MAPTFRTGRCTRVLLNSVDLSVILNDAERSASVDTHDVTTYAQADYSCTTDKSYIVGNRDASFSFSGLADASTDEVDTYIETSLGTTSARILTYGPGGSAVGDRAYLSRIIATEFTVTSPAQDVVAVSASMQGDVTNRAGVWLISPNAATTSTGAKAGVMDRTFWASTASGAGSTGGAYVHFHHLSSSTRSTGLTVKAQHSSDNTTWADIFSITMGTTAPFSWFSTIAPPTKEWVRGIVTAKTSTFDPRIALAIGRSPERSTSLAMP